MFHNRLTHSLQVAQVGRRLAEKLRYRYPKLTKDLIDPDVVEAACLAHDLGHPPFGHVAEHQLNELAKDVGGFEGNAQTFRIVTRLASRSAMYPGLDLTAATLAAILKYPWLRNGNPEKPKKWGAYRSEREDFKFARCLSPSKNKRTIEAELMDWADDVTYSVHDLEDFYRAGRMPLHLLAQRDSPERTFFFENVFSRREGDPEFRERTALEGAFAKVLLPTFSIVRAYDGSADHRAALRNFTGTLIGRYVNAATIKSYAGKSRLVIDPELRHEVIMLKELTWTYVIEASSLAAQQRGKRQVIGDLFHIYTEAAEKPGTWGIFPTYYRERLDKYQNSQKEKVRICIDLLASMTESQAIAMHHVLTGQAHSSGLDEILR